MDCEDSSVAAEVAVRPAAELEAEFASIRRAWLHMYDTVDSTGPAVVDMKVIEERLRGLVASTVLGTKTTSDAKYRTLRGDVRQRLMLCLCQQGRDTEAQKLLEKAGFRARLAPGILNYPVEGQPSQPLLHDADEPEERAPLIVADGLLSDSELQCVSRVFVNPRASYWTAHRYSIDPPSPYFSYVIPIEDAVASGTLGAFGVAVRAALAALRCHRGDAVASEARFAELWAHNRPHASGHQMHFDSDDEGRGGIRNPIMSTVLYLTTGIGGPTVVTNQRLSSAALATKAWVANPVRGRLVGFDGDVLHGVVPGKGAGPQIAAPPMRLDDSDDPSTTGTPSGGSLPRRVTVMVALWRDLRIRDEAGAGAARPLPDPSTSQWCAELTSCPVDTVPPATDGNASSVPRNTSTGLAVSPVWTTPSTEPWSPDRRLPPYEKAFQGF